MPDQCIIFSLPSSTTSIQIATRTGSQATRGSWTGSMKFSNLKVSQSVDRSPTCSFDIVDYNSSDNINTWMVPGVAVFVVYQGNLAFSGIITKVDGTYVGFDTSGTNLAKEMFSVSCESDANYLMNYTPTRIGTSYKNTYAGTVMYYLTYPYVLWNGSRVAIPFNYYCDSNPIDYTITNKPILQQVKDICATTGGKYRCRTLRTYGTITVSGTTVTMTSSSPDDFISNTSSSSDLNHCGYSTHNKNILVLISKSGLWYHDCAVPVLTTSDTSNTMLIDNVSSPINWSQFANGAYALLIQQPILEYRLDFEAKNAFVMYTNPTSHVPPLSPYVYGCFEYNPLSEKNDVITKVVVSGTDASGVAISACMAAAYPTDPTTYQFTYTGAAAPVYVARDEMTLARSVDKADTKIPVFSDLGYTWAVGDSIRIGGYEPSSSFGVWTWRTMNFTIAGLTDGITDGRPIKWLNIAPSTATYNWSANSIISKTTASSEMRIYLNTNPPTGIGTYCMVGRERVYVVTTGYDTIGSTVYWYLGVDPDRGNNYFDSAKIGHVPNMVYPHKAGCPVLESSYMDVDDSHVNSPMRTYGLITKNLFANNVTDAGTLEIIAYRMVMSLCRPKNKGTVKTHISVLSSFPDSFDGIAGDQCRVTMYDNVTVHPSGSWYRIVSSDMDFDTGVAMLKFDEYDINFVRALSQFGLNINIY